MTRQPRSADLALTALVLFHVAICLLHGFAHTHAGVTLSRTALLFVMAVILAGPVVGLALRYSVAPRAGAWTVAATLAASCVFGLVNHFVIQGADHVLRVAGPYQALFGITAALLMVSEATGAGLAVRAAAGKRSAVKAG